MLAHRIVPPGDSALIIASIPIVGVVLAKHVGGRGSSSRASARTGTSQRIERERRMSITTLSLDRVWRANRSASTETSAEAVRHDPIPFRFSGDAGEYFRIWAVNTALSIVTLGIYSAWAKVCRVRYFYANTSMDGSAFTYHASPVAILKGRVIAVTALITLVALQHFQPVAGQILSVGIGLTFPYLLVRALVFRNGNSSYRGIRFGKIPAHAVRRGIVLLQSSSR